MTEPSAPEATLVVVSAASDETPVAATAEPVAGAGSTEPIADSDAAPPSKDEKKKPKPPKYAHPEGRDPLHILKHAVMTSPLSYVMEVLSTTVAADGTVATVLLAGDTAFAHHCEALRLKWRVHGVVSILNIIFMILLWGSVLVGAMSSAAASFGASLPESVGAIIIIALAVLGAPGVAVTSFLKSGLALDAANSKSQCLAIIAAAVYRHSDRSSVARGLLAKVPAPPPLAPEETQPLLSL